ncbi:MAG TPA: hypothetical protein DCW88_18790 [Agrobacterium sp.]|nr:hypothetical protein [Agrobacterium sp.]
MRKTVVQLVWTGPRVPGVTGSQFARKGRGECYTTLKAAVLTPLDEFAQQGNGMRGGAETQKRPKACWDAHQYL